ncbi:MAG: GNAT family N-acetyltransferase [Clostridia bacterium]|nr:GNAT family N-acetyltransferase [Clostridia bacterium]
MNQSIIRPARAGDYPQVEKLMQQVQALHVSWRPDIYKPCETVLAYDHFLDAAAKGTMLVAELDGEIVGLLSCMERHVESARQVTRDVLFIDVMVVAESYRGQGIGRQMFDHLKLLAKEKHCDGIELQVNARNAAAFEMYRHCGFSVKSINMELL